MKRRLAHFLIVVVFPEQNTLKSEFSYQKNKYIMHFVQDYSLIFPVLFTKTLFIISGIRTEI